MTDYSPVSVRQRGVVMVITLLALLLLVGLVLWVLNLSQQVNRRIATQHAADAAAIGGATWTARTMNTVARHNLAMARYAALVPVLDSMPQAVDYTLREQQALRDALDVQLSRGVGSGEAQLMSEVRDELNALLEQFEKEIEQLEPVHAFFQQVDVRRMTAWNGPEGRGRLWRAMKALDDASVAVVDALADSAQTAASYSGRVNLRQASGDAIMVPLVAELPVQRGEFGDLRRPVLDGRLPDDIDDPELRRGPYDTLFGWHYPRGEYRGGIWSPGTSSGPGGAGNVPPGLGSGPGHGGRWVGGRWEWRSYETYGPLDWMVNRGLHRRHVGLIRQFVLQHLELSRLDYWMDELARIRIGYLWPEAGDVDWSGWSFDEAELVELVEPDWEINFDNVTATAARDEQSIRETAFFAFEMKSRYPKDHPAFMSEGSWAPITDGGMQQARVVRVSGWEDPRNWPVAKVTDHGWRDEWEYEIYWDTEIGLEPRTDPDGNMILQRVYRYDHYYFAGANVGEPVGVDHPFAGFDPRSPDAPAPLMLDRSLRDPDAPARRDHLRFLAAAQQEDGAENWRSAFYSGKPHPYMVALAEAEVFNNHSWDLWTPMWHAQLVPVREYGEWVKRLDEQLGALNLPTGMNAAEAAALLDYLRSIEPLAEQMMEH